ncbi:MAG TPA: Fe-S cluster assembly transcriptional regulator IscR, partial [Oceanospirillales bacterium]|nr:Fe-S cluster assembly transcriptional regulator IscR [Oceanospirillales bacterium]
SYLEQLFAKLRRNGLVESIRGPGGGYRLSRQDHEINVAEIVDAVNETIDATRCNQKGDCHDGEKCLTHHLWMDLSDQIHGFLSGISLNHLVDRRETLEISRRQGRKGERISALAEED